LENLYGVKQPREDANDRIAFIVSSSEGAKKETDKKRDVPV